MPGFNVVRGQCGTSVKRPRSSRKLPVSEP
jgi:hypothetical protein